jgi:hypothetical protein
MVALSHKARFVRKVLVMHIDAASEDGESTSGGEDVFVGRKRVRYRPLILPVFLRRSHAPASQIPNPSSSEARPTISLERKMEPLIFTIAPAIKYCDKRHT